MRFVRSSDGCIVAVQSDNETCYMFHDEAYATDYSPASIAALPSPATLALGVYLEDALWLGLILICERGQIRRVTTFEGLHSTLSNPGPTEQTLTTLCEALSAQFASPAAVLLCTNAVFSGWLAASDKLAYLAAARVDAMAIWHVVPVT